MHKQIIFIVFLYVFFVLISNRELPPSAPIDRRRPLERNKTSLQTERRPSERNKTILQTEHRPPERNKTSLQAETEEVNGEVDEPDDEEVDDEEADDESLNISEEENPIIAICAPTHSKSNWRTLDDTSLKTLLIPSIQRTITASDRSKYSFRLYLGADHDDTFWLRNRDNVETPEWLPVHIGFYETPKHKIPFNPLMRTAYNDGAEYFVRINDDTEFVTSDWVSKAVAKLSSYDPPNVGMVGPNCREGNTAIMTHDMVHRTHLDIFEHYYPDVFSAWWIDDWISKVYGPERSTKMMDWRVTHHTHKHGTRYAVQHHEAQLLKGELERGALRISQWLPVSNAKIHKWLLGNKVSISKPAESPTCTNGHMMLNKCFCNAGYRGDSCNDKFRDVLPCIDKGNRVRSDVSGESGTDRCFQSREYGRMVPPDAAERWKKAQKFETSLWAKNSGSEDRIHTHEVGFDYFKALGQTPSLGSFLEVGSGPFTQTKGILHNVPAAKVDSLFFYDPGMDTYLKSVAQCSYKTGKLAKYKSGGFWPYSVTTSSTMPTSQQFDTVASFNVITHVQNGYTWLQELYDSVKPGGLLLFSDYYFDGTHENFWYVPDAYYHPVRPFWKVYEHFFKHFEILYEHKDVIHSEPRGLHDTVGYWILRKKPTESLSSDNPVQNHKCLPKPSVHYRSQSNEDKAIIEQVYSGKPICKGTIVEIGALDGKRYSNSWYFEHALQWKAVLIEANPKNFKALKSNRPNAINIHSAMCSGESIEFIGHGAIGGMVSTMSEKHRTGWIRPSDDVTRVPCQKFEQIFSKYEIKHVDIFVLDVEGGEFEVLKTMDWSVTVGVWVVELDKGDLEKNRMVRQLLRKNGYIPAVWDIRDWCSKGGDCTSNEVFVPGENLSSTETRTEAPTSAARKAVPDIITNKKYIRLCDVAFKTRSRNDLELPLRRNAIVCAGGERAILNEFFKLDIRTPFTLVTIENDEATPQDVTWLKHKYLTRWYSWNSNHPEVHPIPIGLNEDSQLLPMVRAKRAASKTMKLLVNFKQDRPERKSLHNRLKSLDWVHVEPYSKKWQSQVKLTTHYESISKYTWTLCPRGAGQDTHRLWEALYLGSIPVVLKSNLSPLYAGLPVIQLESWDQLSLETLKTLSKSLPTSRRNANFGYWANIIRGAHTNKKKKILAYSLYGSDRRYTDGALANSKLYHEIYPDWDMRVYHDKTVPESIINELRNNGVDLVDMTGSPLNKMSWRFLPASDSKVDRFCARDIDSRLSNREKAAVDAWIESGKKFHVMRDHPSHSKYAMSGGMWCGTHDAAPDMDKLLQKRHMTQSYLQDMNFLNNVIWPIAKDHILQHDSFSCDKFGGGSPFPTRRIGWEHVGSVFINGKMRKGDVDILKKAGVVEKCVMSQVPEKNPTSSLEISVSGAESDHAVTNQLLECMQPTDVKNIDLRKGVSGSTEELLLKQIKPHIDLANRISVDIGGNQGVFSELIGKVFGKPPMYIFDVIPRFVADLRSKFPESTVEHLAVSDGSVETVDIKGASTWKSDFNTGASILTRGPSYDSVLATVKTTTLDTFFMARSGGKTDIAFLKVDTEGADGRVLRGAEKMLRAKKINCIFWENNKMQNEIGDSLYKNVQFLNSVGYSSFVVAHDTLFPISACREDTGVFDLNRPTGNILSVVTGSPLWGALVKVHGFKKIAEVPSNFKPSAKHPYPVTKLKWGACTTQLGKPSLFDAAKKTWRVVISSDTNTNYLAFAPSVVAHWKRRGIEVSLGLVVTKADSKAKVDGLVRAIKEATEMDIRVLPIDGKIGLPTGHAAKLARAFMATQFDDDDVVTIVDIDYYLLWFEQWSAHLKCTPEDGLLALGYNRYRGTKDEGKYPMYLGTAKSSVFSKFLNPDREASFETWIQRFKDIHVFDSNESPFSHWGQFSDESLFRALLSRSPLPTVWVNTPTSWKRIDRAHSHPVTNSELSIAADVFPNRPLDVCKTYNERLRPVHRFLGIEDPNREKNFINALIELNVQNRDWGQGRFKKTSTLENCI